MTLRASLELRQRARSDQAGSLADFEAYAAQDPDFAAAGAQIKSQLLAEGAGQTRIELAQSSFADAFDQLGKLGVQIPDPISNARDFVLQGQTIAGAVETVQGLSAAVQSGSPVVITQQFTGVMIGLAGAAGIVSAGVGAAIVAGVAGLLQAMQNAGLFGGNPGVAICQGVNATSQPDLVVGCLAGFTSAPQVPPGHADWRTFPAKTKTGDLVWYGACGNGGCSDFNWGGVDWSNKLTANPPGPMRPIDWAFGAFSSGCEPYLGGPLFQSTIGPAGFSDGWCAAWKSNAEYALNGLKAQDDALVLAHYVRLFNVAHAGPAVGLSTFSGPYTYLSGLIQRARTFAQSEDLFGDSDLGINTGALHGASRVVKLTLPSKPKPVVRFTLAGASRATAPSSSSTSNLLLAGALGLGAVALLKPAWLRKLGVRL